MNVEVKEVKKPYVKGCPVLKGVSLQAGENEIVGLVGMNGAGKSTLMRVISGISKVDSGSITFNHTPICQLSNRQRRRIEYFCAENIFRFMLKYSVILIAANIFAGIIIK